MWRKDPTLWGEATTAELADRLGWLDLPETMHAQVESLNAFAGDVRRAGFEHAVLCGMGGSSLAPEVYQRVFGNAEGYPELIVLDSTHPDAVRAVHDRIDPARTLFIVSSKSGTTSETLAFFEYFYYVVADAGVRNPGRRFVAVTDPGSKLEATARERAFRHVFLAPPDVGGRYAALSVFGLVPAAAIGLDTHRILDGAWTMMEFAGAEVKAEDNPALRLGAAIGEAARDGRDKLTIFTSPAIDALPAWIEQLIAESTGKDGVGVVPIVGEAPAAPSHYGDDRFFVHVAIRDEAHANEELLRKLERADHPVAWIEIDDCGLLGQEFLRWEIATAAAGSVLGIHPFNQPDVQLAKDLARERMNDAADVAAGWDDGVETLVAADASAPAALDAFLNGAGERKYIALQAYVAPHTAVAAALEELRQRLHVRYRCATTFGFGPRYLHSTGQLHKGGAANGIFVQIVDEAARDVAIPASDVTFGQLIRAQAQGDAAALRERGRRIIRVRTGDDDANRIASWLHD